MRKREYLFFDLDGTLIDSKPGITRSVRYALAKMGIQVDDPDTLQPFIGPPLKECFRELYGFEGNAGELAVYYYREYFSQKGIYQNELYPGIPRLLQALEDAGKKLVLATSLMRVVSAETTGSLRSGCILRGNYVPPYAPSSRPRGRSRK